MREFKKSVRNKAENWDIYQKYAKHITGNHQEEILPFKSNSCVHYLAENVCLL